MLKRQAGVAFALKDLRSSIITFLLSDANSDEVLIAGAGGARMRVRERDSTTNANHSLTRA